MADEDEREALIFLRKTVYFKIARSQGAKLKSPLYGSGDPVEKFKSGK